MGMIKIILSSFGKKQWKMEKELDVLSQYYQYSFFNYGVSRKCVYEYR